MRILHTADWHIGQTLDGWSREYEHQVFFDTLRDLIATEGVDALLMPATCSTATVRQVKRSDCFMPLLPSFCVQIPSCKS